MSSPETNKEDDIFFNIDSFLRMRQDFKIALKIDEIVINDELSDADKGVLIQQHIKPLLPEHNEE